MGSAGRWGWGQGQRGLERAVALLGALGVGACTVARTCLSRVGAPQQSEGIDFTHHSDGWPHPWTRLTLTMGRGSDLSRLPHPRWPLTPRACTPQALVEHPLRADVCLGSRRQQGGTFQKQMDSTYQQDLCPLCPGPGRCDSLRG